MSSSNLSVQRRSPLKLPVCAVFESLSREMFRACARVTLNPRDQETQSDFCRHLRVLSWDFQKVVECYGSRYRGGEGASQILGTIRQAIALGFEPDSKLLSSVHRYLKRLDDLQWEHFEKPPRSVLRDLFSRFSFPTSHVTRSTAIKVGDCSPP